jgi:phosphoribosylanthranilate isomerase
MGIKVKICGITNLKDALDSVAAGCDAIGFVFYKKSPRYINPLKAREIAAKLPQRIIKIGVFVNDTKRNIVKIAKVCRLDMIQFHGHESAQFCRKFRDYKIIKAFRIKDSINKKEVSRYKTFAYLFDTFNKFTAGGTGNSFDWEIISKIDWIKKKVFLSGGLNEHNLQKATKIVQPDWLDVSSSVEERIGKKDKHKLERFIQAAKKEN